MIHKILHICRVSLSILLFELGSKDPHCAFVHLFCSFDSLRAVQFSLKQRSLVEWSD